MDIAWPPNPDAELAAQPSRPHMPGSGLLGPAPGSALFDWAWAHESAPNLWFGLRPVWAFAFDEDNFSGSPTRWSFREEEG